MGCFTLPNLSQINCKHIKRNISHQEIPRINLDFHFLLHRKYWRKVHFRETFRNGTSTKLLEIQHGRKVHLNGMKFFSACGEIEEWSAQDLTDKQISLSIYLTILLRFINKILLFSLGSLEKSFQRLGKQ